MMNFKDYLIVDETGMKDALNRTMIELAGEDERIVHLEADLGIPSGMQATFKAKWPDRYFECGIQEANMMGVACGMSTVGVIPFLHTFACFIARKCTDQIYISGCYSRQNVKIIGSDPGVTTENNGASHAGNEDMGILRSFPGMYLFDPCDPVELEAVVRMAKDLYGMCYIRFNRRAVKKIYPPDYKFEIGKGNILREGTDVTIIASGIMVAEALAAADMLEAEGVSARVVDLFTWKPLDTDLIIRCAKETGAIVTAENHNIHTGLGASIASATSTTHPVPIGMIAIPDTFGQVGSTAYQLKAYNLTAQDICEKTRETIRRK